MEGTIGKEGEVEKENWGEDSEEGWGKKGAYLRLRNRCWNLVNSLTPTALPGRRIGHFAARRTGQRATRPG